MSSVENVLEGYLRRPELAKQLRRTERTLARWEELRIGPAVTRIGREPAYHVDSVRVWLKAQEQPTPRAHHREVA